MYYWIGELSFHKSILGLLSVLCKFCASIIVPLTQSSSWCSISARLKQIFPALYFMNKAFITIWLSRSKKEIWRQDQNKDWTKFPSKHKYALDSIFWTTHWSLSGWMLQVSPKRSLNHCWHGLSYKEWLEQVTVCLVLYLCFLKRAGRGVFKMSSL